MKKRNLMIVLIIVLCMIMGTACGSVSTGSKTTPVAAEMALENINKGLMMADASLHDPAMAKGEDGKYYMYGSHMTAATSTDLRNWKMFGNGVDANNPMFDNLIVEPFEAFEFVGENNEGWYSVWAPCIIYNDVMGKYMMYFCTTSSYIKSNLCFATADDIGGPYTYQDTILYSGFAKLTARETNIYDIIPDDKTAILQYDIGAGFNNGTWPNCIDPALFYDEENRLWMVYGSWSGGIFLLEIDKATGQIIHPEEDIENGVDDYYGKRLVGGMHHAIEGPHIEYDKESGYYYLFVSYGGLTRTGGYQIRVYRSEKVDGPYVDMKGNTVWEEENIQDYGVKLMGNYTLPNLNAAYMAPGGQSAYTDEDGKKYVVYHQRFDMGTEYHEPRVHQYFINEEGWPVVAPHATSGESLSENGYDTAALSGTFYLLNHGSAVDAVVNEPLEAHFADGVITGDVSGTYTVTEGTNFAQITIDGVTYKGVLVEMMDDTNNATFNFTGIGSNNQSLWGVHYIESLQSVE